MGSLIDHILECAEEMGVDFPVPTSHEQSIPYKGMTIELYFEETGSVYAWKAFVMGLGTRSGITAAEAVDASKAWIDSTTEPPKSEQ